MRRAVPGRVMHLCRDIAEGLQVEWLHSHDLRLEPGEVPVNQDGEVAEFMCLPVAEALARAASDEMTVDAALVTLDFALRHRLLDDPALPERLLSLLQAHQWPADALMLELPATALSQPGEVAQSVIHPCRCGHRGGQATPTRTQATMCRGAAPSHAILPPRWRFSSAG